jgi:hypothetical protein
MTMKQINSSIKKPKIARLKNKEGQALSHNRPKLTCAGVPLNAEGQMRNRTETERQGVASLSPHTTTIGQIVARNRPLEERLLYGANEL